MSEQTTDSMADLLEKVRKHDPDIEKFPGRMLDALEAALELIVAWNEYERNLVDKQADLDQMTWRLRNVQTAEQTLRGHLSDERTAWCACEHFEQIGGGVAADFRAHGWRNRRATGWTCPHCNGLCRSKYCTHLRCMERRKTDD